MKRVFITVSLTLIAVFMVYYVVDPIMEKQTLALTPPPITTATLIKPRKPITDFALTDTTEKPFTEKSLLGQWTMMFFGYAECPETCPKTLTTINEFWGQLPADIRFVFVSLDPKSDTVQNLSAFLGRFNPNFIGLTGEEAVIEKLGKSCGIYSWRDMGASQNDSTKPKIIDHSAILLLINPQGQLHAVFSPPYDANKMGKDIQQIMAYSQSSPQRN